MYVSRSHIMAIYGYVTQRLVDQVRTILKKGYILDIKIVELGRLGRTPSERRYHQRQKKKKKKKIETARKCRKP